MHRKIYIFTERVGGTKYLPGNKKSTFPFKNKPKIYFLIFKFDNSKQGEHIHVLHEIFI